MVICPRKYSNAQIESTKALLLLLSDKHGIDINKGIKEMLILSSKEYDRQSVSYLDCGNANVFDYRDDLSCGKTKGILTHGQVRKDKSDVFPQRELMSMLINL